MKIDLLKNIDEGGCSAKFPASQLHEALKNLKLATNTNLIVGINTYDDAGVYKINDDLALIQTTDFFPPVCSDPYEFGQIAAVNALSDVYAMGGEVLTALNILMFPKDLPLIYMKEILQGGADKVHEAGGTIIGGHTIYDSAIKYGLAVTGSIHPSRVITNSAAKIGDLLILTKPLGGGVILSGKKADIIDEEKFQSVMESMKQLNKKASALMQKHDIKCATDITGFGLLGHALKMAESSKVSFQININYIPFFPGAMLLVQKGCIPGAAFTNKLYSEKYCHFDEKINYEQKILLNDAQTSGGLLIACPPIKAEVLKTELVSEGFSQTAIIGEVVTISDKLIQICF